MEPISRHSRAFSIVELLVVIAIMGILMALTVPAVSSLMRIRTSTRAAQLVESQIQLARSLHRQKTAPSRCVSSKCPASPLMASARFSSGRWTRPTAPMPHRHVR